MSKNVEEIFEQFDSEADDRIKKLIDSLENSFDDIERGFFENYEKVDLLFKKVNDYADDPHYNYETDSGFDLQSMEEFTLAPLERRLVPTGLAFDIPEGYEIQIRPRSGLAIKTGLTVVNTPGTVDCGWTDEIKAIVINLSNEPISIKKGMKIVQGVLCPVVNGRKVRFGAVDEIRNKDRNKNGFGSTGV